MSAAEPRDPIWGGLSKLMSGAPGPLPLPEEPEPEPEEHDPRRARKRPTALRKTHTLGGDSDR